MADRVRIGTNPIAWSNDDKRSLGSETSLETCLAEAREAGFSGIELGHKFPRDADLLRPVLDAQGLELISGWYSAELLTRSVDDEKAALEAHLSLLEKMGCNVIVWAETSGCIHGNENVPLSQRPVIPAAQWPEFSEKLSAMAAYTRSRGLRLSYHHHMGTVIQTGAEIEKLMETTGDDVGLLLDTGHLTFAGSDPAEFAARFADRIAHVHCKDIRTEVLDRAISTDSSFLDAVVDGVFTVPGDGDIDFVAALKHLADSPYRGWLVVEAEQDPAKANPLKYARLGCTTLSSIAAKLGLAT